ncbi:MAG: 2-amino-4-hydroxy-6-hydroxymethyldihydropteridine diphosphokinase [Deltaproteobacteria bacterium]|nr:MAG: 2-amino-4-hydroxy-6-hydroxymethyldihydropteridine diphosphokinase [Deltaproteobacteria bacterium]
MAFGTVGGRIRGDARRRDATGRPAWLIARVRAYVGLGSNLGDRAAHLAWARKRLAARCAEGPLEASPLYETRPLDCRGGPFVNQVAVFDTRLSPEELLDVLLDLEIRRGRVRGRPPGRSADDPPPAPGGDGVSPLLHGAVDRFDPAEPHRADAGGTRRGGTEPTQPALRPRHAARPLDLDLLAMADGGEWIERRTADLALPHPRVFERDFVLVPLLDLEPTLVVAGQPLRTALAALPATARTILRRLPVAPGPPAG